MSYNLLGVDFGTTSLKACLFNENGERLATASVKYQLITEGSFIEYPAEGFFDAFLEVFNEISSSYKIDAMSIDTQGETMVVLDKDGNPLMNAISWLDNRAEKESKQFAKHFGLKKVYNWTGEPEVPAGYPAPKIMWLKNNVPEVYNKADKFLLLEDYIIYKLTGNCVASRSLYSSSLLMNLHSGEYIPEVLSYLGIKEDNLSKLCESGTVVGEYKGVAVVTSAMDQIAGITGAGVVKEGLMSETTGTALAVCAITQKFPPYYKGMKVSVYYVRKDLFCILMWAPTAGATLEWFKNTFCENMSYDDLNVLAEAVPKGSEGLICLPHLCGTVMPYNKPNAKGTFIGIELKHKRGHFIRAVMESIAYNIREFIDLMNLPIDEIRSMGGGAKSKVWCEIKSSVSGKKIITLKENETACLGSAIFAGMGIGVYKDTVSATEKVVKENKTYSVSEEDYKDLFNNYVKMEKDALDSVYKG